MNKAAALLIVVVMASGCSTVLVEGGGAATYQWVSGWLEANFHEPLPELERATRVALKELKLVGIEGSVDKLQGEVTARMASGKKVRVKLKALDFEETKLRIRVGTVGDKTLSEQILRHIKREL
ncbi:MAG: DUF3568 family protein [bacterium]|nr:DUF3568 family protein [bacterium]